MLRPAVESDRDLVFVWANDPLTRAMSFSSEPISATDHARWFAKALAGHGRRLFVAESDGAPLGVLRLDFSTEARHSAEVGINLAESARGRGGRDQARLPEERRRPIIHSIDHNQR